MGQLLKAVVLVASRNLDLHWTEIEVTEYDQCPDCNLVDILIELRSVKVSGICRRYLVRISIRSLQIRDSELQ